MKNRALLPALLLLALLLPAAALADMMIGDAMTVVRCEEYITLREAEDTKSAELDRVPLGAQVTYLAEAENKFYHVAYENQTGYALRSYLKAEETAASPAAVSRAAREEINYFLSSLSASGLSVLTGGSVQDAQLVEIALWYLWYNRNDLFMGSDLDAYSRRLTDVHAERMVRQLFGREIAGPEAAHQHYENGYYYMNEPGGPMGYGFASMSHAEWIDDTRLRVYFGLYAQGEGWSRESCALLPEQAVRLYPEAPVHQGCAVIRVNGGSLEDSGAWTLESWAVVT